MNNINPFCCIFHLRLYSAEYVANCEIDLQSWGHPIWHSWHSVDLYFVLCVRVCMLSCFSHVQLFVTLWIVAHQAPLFMGFCRQEYWSGLTFLPPGSLPDPGIKPVSLASTALADEFFTTKPPRKPPMLFHLSINLAQANTYSFNYCTSTVSLEISSLSP